MKRRKQKSGIAYKSGEIAELAGQSSHKALVSWAADCAENALAFFEEKHPDDRRPRDAIEKGRAWVRGEISTGEARTAAFSAHEAARIADPKSAASAAARAAGQAAATAHVPGHAVHAAAYAAKAVLCGTEPDGAADAVIKEREWQYHRLNTWNNLLK